MSNRTRIVMLWVIFLFGMFTHMDLAVMPIFFGVNVTMPNATGVVPTGMMWMALFFWLAPMIIIALTLFIEATWYKITNFVFSLLFTFMNVWHLKGHLGESAVDPRQIVLMTFVLIAGIILNIVSFKWVRE